MVDRTVSCRGRPVTTAWIWDNTSRKAWLAGSICLISRVSEQFENTDACTEPYPDGRGVYLKTPEDTLKNSGESHNRDIAPLLPLIEAPLAVPKCEFDQSFPEQRLRQEAMPVGDDAKVRNRWAPLRWLDDQRPAIGGDRVVTCNRIGLAKGPIVDDSGLTGHCPTRPKAD